jgi:mannose/fructose/N-acetylgalactosamine-specific phosphotransferase system component IIC
MTVAWPGLQEMLLLLLLAGWAAADTTAAFQFMVGQPLVMGCLAGAVIGQPGAGLAIGAALQLLWSRLTPVGAAAYPDVGPATVAGVAAAGILLRGEPAWRPAFEQPFPAGRVAVATLTGALVAILAGRLGQVLTVALRRDNARLAHAADRFAGTGSFRGVEWENALGVLRSFARGLVVFLVGFGLFAGIHAILPALSVRIPSDAAGGPNPGTALFWWFGLASIVATLWRGGRRDAGLFAGGAAIALLVGALL